MKSGQDGKQRRAIIYCRESRDDYGENYERIEIQRDLLIKFCHDRNIQNIVEIIMDDDKSGTDFKRFDEIKSKAEKKEFDVIVFKNSSRMGRNQREALNFVQFLENYNIEILFEDEKYDEELFGLYAWFNERRARDDSKNIRRNLRHKMEEGKLIIKPIYGYDKVNGQLKKNAQTEQIVQLIFSLYEAGWSKYEIAEELNSKDVKTPSQSRAYNKCKAASKWNTQHITRILLDRRYVGDYVGGRTEKISFKSKKIRVKHENEWIVLKNHHEAIISEEQFLRVNTKLKSKKSCTGTNF